MSNFGIRLKRARKACRITQQQLAKALGVEQSTICNYEKNVRVPSANMMLQLANTLQIGLEQLLQGSEKQSITHTGVPTKLDLKKDAQASFFSDLYEGRDDACIETIMTMYQQGCSIMDIFCEILSPTLVQMGSMWASGELDIAREHFMTHTIDSLIVTITQKIHLDATNEHSAVFVLPGAETHVLGLKMVSVLFKLRAWRVHFLGKSIPVYSLEDYVRRYAIKMVVVSVTTREHLNSAEYLIRAIAAFPAVYRPKVLIGGGAIEGDNHARLLMGADYYAGSFKELDSVITMMESASDQPIQFAK